MTNNSPENIINVMRASFILYDVPLRYKNLIVKAHFDKDWEYYLKSDGTTYENVEWINQFHPVYVWHDWAMQNEERLKEDDQSHFAYVRDTNLTMKKMMEIYRVKFVDTKDERKYKKIFLLSTISKFLFGR